MKRTLLPLLSLLLLLSAPVFGITIKTIDLSATDDTAIEINTPVWDGAQAGPVLIGPSSRSSTARWPAASATP